MTVLRAAAETHTGYVRSTNQDLALVSGDLVAVADGMGGHLGGEVAARTAIEELLEAYLRERTGDGLVSAARRANRAVWRKSRVDRKLHGMGTTLTAAALVSQSAGVGDESGSDRRTQLILVNVGDSRAYVLDKNTRRLRQLTEDHSVVEEMVRQGELTPEEAAVHPHRHVLTRALGIEAEVTLDIWDLAAEVGSRFLLCSDGLTNEVSDQEIAAVLATATSPEHAAKELVGRALGHGGMDNVTVVVADVVEGDLDLSDVPELVPPRPPRPEAPVMGTPELTEAIPVSAPAGTPAVTPPGVPAPGGASPGSGAVALPVSGGTGATSVAGGAIAGAVSGLAGGVVAAAAADGATSQIAAAPPAERARRKGRSMTAPLAVTPAAVGGVIDGDGLAWPDASTAGGARDAGEHARQSGSGFLVDDLGATHTRPIVLVRQKRERAPRDRIVTFRVVVFVLFLVALVGGTAGVIIWYDQSSYFIALHGDSVAIFEGRPGGMLWFKPQLIETSRITTSELLPSTIATLQAGLSESSLSAAEHVTARLKNEKARALAAVTTTTTTTTSTTTTTTTTTFQGTLPPATAPSTTAAPTTTRPPPTTQAPTTTTKPKQSGGTPPSTSATTTTTTTTTGTGN
jgi:serine/threonine protein phosphatase PrpC